MSKKCPSGGVTIIGQPAATDISCTSEIPLPSLAKMDGVIVAVVHDEFRGTGLSGVRGFVGEGAAVVDVREMFGGGEAEGMGFCYKGL